MSRRTLASLFFVFLLVTAASAQDDDGMEDDDTIAAAGSGAAVMLGDSEASPTAEGSDCPNSAVASDKDEFDCMVEYELPAASGSDMTPFRVYWTVDDTKLRMAVQGETEGWVGIAFAEEAGSMVPSDFIIGYVDGDEVDVTPYYSEQRAIAAENAVPEVTLDDIEGEEKDGMTTIYFTRDTEEEGNVPISLTDEVDINFAVGPDDSLAYHNTRRASGKITFS